MNYRGFVLFLDIMKRDDVYGNSHCSEHVLQTPVVVRLID